MSKDTKLIKDFKEKDLARIRNIIEGRYGDKTNISTGYNKKQDERVDGVSFEENGKTWIIKDGIKQSITKMDSFKEYAKFPLKCPCCETAFKLTDLNKKMYHIHNKCFDCVTEMESKLKMKGKFEEYENNILNKNKISILDDFEKALDEYANSKNESFVTEDGAIETWLGNGTDLEYIKNMKEQIRIQKLKNI